MVDPVKFRQNIERLVARRFILNSLAAGYTITVNDGETDVLAKSADLNEILAAMFTTDEDKLFVNFGVNDKVGWAYFVYGNEGYDVVNNYTTNLEPIMKEVDAACERLEDLHSKPDPLTQEQYEAAETYARRLGIL